jgi:hypothetical protein
MNRLFTPSTLVLAMVICFSQMQLWACAPTPPDTVEVVPDWYSQLPTEPGFVYGAGKGISRDLATAKQKSGLLASTAIAQNHPAKFQEFEKRCDTLIDSQTQQQKLVTMVKTTTEIELTNIEVVAMEYFYINGQYIVYELRRVSIANQVKALKKSINGDPQLKKAFKNKALLTELNKL